ncbi:MAG: class I SAM-dependent methyltransferase [Candidatus Sabulitectum sp.]|nr:class I SAM-dependent methyltransferase [Candidatus Sabulitectum sp.]
MGKEKSSLETALGKLPGGAVLDVATGAGNFASAMEHCFANCYSVIAIDSSAGSLKLINERIESDKILPAAMDGSLLAFKDGTFNTVAISNSLHHLNNPDAILREMMRSLAPGGHFIIMEMFRDGDQTSSQQTHTMLHNWWAAVDSRNGVVHNPVFTQKELKERAENIGLTELEFHINEDLSGNPFDPELMSYLSKALDTYEKRAADMEDLMKQGRTVRRYLKKHGFTGARALIAVGTKSC